MDFLLWTARSLHIFAVVVWFGGILYQSAVVFPVAKAGGNEVDAFPRHLLRRFQPFIWMSVWTILITGVGLMLFNPGFVWLQFRDRWSVLLGLKEVVFLLMLFFSFGYARMFRMFDAFLERNERGEKVARAHYQMVVFGKINAGLAIIALLLAAGLHS